MNVTLYQLVGEYREVAERLYDLALDEQTIADTLESLSGDLEAKAVATACVIRNMASFADQIKQAEQSMADRRKAYEKRAEALHKYLFDAMEATQIGKIESPQFCLTIKKNPKSVVIEDERMIPVEFMTKPEPPPPAPDKKAIKVALEAGTEVNGAKLHQEKRLEIK